MDRNDDLKKENNEYVPEKMEKEVVLTYIGEDDWNHPIYEVGDTGTYVKDIELGRFEKPVLCWSCPKNDPYGEPDYAFVPKEGVNLVVHGPEKETVNESEMTQEQMDAMEVLHGFKLDGEPQFRYGMLSRLKMDCDYYLGNGNYFAGHLWADSEKKHIEIMKNLYNSFPDSAKPEWITRDEINEYERKMVTERSLNKKFQEAKKEKNMSECRTADKSKEEER